MQNGKEIPKQRGIYSEILTTEDTANLNVSYLLPKLLRAFRLSAPTNKTWSRSTKSKKCPVPLVISENRNLFRHKDANQEGCSQRDPREDDVRWPKLSAAHHRPRILP